MVNFVDLFYLFQFTFFTDDVFSGDVFWLVV